MDSKTTNVQSAAPSRVGFITRKTTDNTDRLDQIIGQLAALKTFCVAVLATHPEPETLSKCLSTLSEVTIAKTLGDAASEPMLAGVENVLADLKMAADRRLSLNR